MNKTTKPMTWNKRFRALGYWYDKSTFKHWSAFIVILLLSIIFIIISLYVFKTEGKEESNSKYFFLWHHIFRDVGIALFPIGLMSLVYEFILRDTFIENMKVAFDERMPKNYENIRNSGIVDVYPNLRITERQKDILALPDNSEIRILDIWMENLHAIQEEIIEVVKIKKCSLKVILWNVRTHEALVQRAKSLNDMKYLFLVNKLIDNYQVLNTIINSVENYFKSLDDYNERKEYYKSLVQVKLYNCFIGVSLIYYGSEYLMGTYLRDTLSSHRTHLKISDDKSFFHKELDNHFLTQWNDNSNIIFNQEEYSEIMNWYGEQKWG